MDYGRVLTRALELTWRHKWLWLLALFAAEGGGSFTYSGQGLNGGFSSGNRTAPPSATVPDFHPVQVWIAANAGLLLAGALGLVIILIVLFVLSCGAEAALVRGT